MSGDSSFIPDTVHEAIKRGLSLSCPNKGPERAQDEEGGLPLESQPLLLASSSSHEEVAV